MNRYTYAMFLFFLITLPVVGQERLTLSERPSTQSLESAKQLIKSAETAATKLAVAGYALIEIRLAGKLTHYVVPGSDDCIITLNIPKGTVYHGWFYVDGELKWVKIEAADIDRVLVSGTKKGTATLIWMGVKGDEAVVVAAFQFEVAGGKPKPPEPDNPPPPIDDPLVKTLRAAAQKDATAGKADKKWLLPLAAIYEAASNDSLESMATMGDLDSNLNKAREASGIPAPELQFMNLRKAIQTHIYEQLGIDKNSAGTPLKVDTRRLAKTAMANIAATLEVLAK